MKGHHDSLQEMFETLTTMLKEGFMYIQGKIITQFFNSCVEVGCLNQKLDWVEQFIIDHQDKIFAVQGGEEEILTYARLTLQFHRKEYALLLESIDTFKFNDTIYDAKRRVLEIKTLFHLERGDLIFDKLDLLKRFVKNRKDISETISEKILSFVTLTNELCRHRMDFSPLAEDFQNRVQSANVAELGWLNRVIHLN